MRVGVYVDAFNVYYGGRSLARKAGTTLGWKWLDLFALADRLIDRGRWPNADVSRMAYCSAPRSQTGDTRGSADQRSYFRALEGSANLRDALLTLELGRYVHTEKSGILLQGRRGDMVHWSSVDGEAYVPAWLKVRPITHVDGVRYALADFKAYEEKGSDVNVATHLLLDVLGGSVDAAVVFSNDSDLALPVEIARRSVPVGLVNPSTRPTAKALQGDAASGVGRHWWRRLSFSDLAASQMSDPCGDASKPSDW